MQFGSAFLGLDQFLPQTSFDQFGSLIGNRQTIRESQCHRSPQALAFRDHAGRLIAGSPVFS
jgi:hypothetical protein